LLAGTDPNPQLYQSVCRVTSITTEGKASYHATAFAVTPDLLLTAGHFCAGVAERISEGKEIPVQALFPVDKLGQPREIIPATILSFEYEKGGLDICLLVSPNHGLVPLRLAGSADHLRNGDTIYTAGFPQATYGLVHRSGHLTVIDPPVIYVSLYIEPGASGSPALKNDEVIGMVIRYKNDELFGTTILLSVDELVEYLAAAGG